MLGVTPQAVSQWKTHGVPLERCMPIEDLTAGEVTRRELRPHDAEKIWPDLRSARKGKRRAVKV
jgi:DNA-binding transcriptional regulator YdaS (Cro superfamily)